MVQFGQIQTGGTRLSTTHAPRNPKVKAAMIKNAGTDREHTEDEARQSRVQKSIARSKEFSKVCDILAQDKFCYRRHPIPKGKELFPFEWRMQFVDYFYPYAAAFKPHGLYIDFPQTEHDIALCVRKQKVMQEKGLPYTFVKVNEGAWEGQTRLDGGDPDKIKADQTALLAKRVNNEVVG